MALFSDFEFIIYLAWWIGLGSVILSCLLFLSILVMRGHFEKNQKRAEAFRNTWEPLIIESLDLIPENLPQIEKTTS